MLNPFMNSNDRKTLHSISLLMKLKFELFGCGSLTNSGLVYSTTYSSSALVCLINIEIEHDQNHTPGHH